MQKLSNFKFLNTFIVLFVLIFIAKSIALALWFFLPDEGIDLKVEQNYKPQYTRVDFKNMLESSKGVASNKQNKPVSRADGINITNMILKGLYGNNENGVAIVALKSSPKKTTLVAIGEEFSSYTLKSILPTSVVFIKDNKEYILKMQESKASQALNNSSITIFQDKANEVDEGGVKNVSKSDINSYADNPKQLMKDISVVEYKEGGQIQGFKISRLRKNSKIATLGVRQGDIIIRANNMDIKSYNDALKLYKNMNTLRTVQLVVLRNNEEKEFVYEIN